MKRKAIFWMIVAAALAGCGEKAETAGGSAASAASAATPIPEKSATLNLEVFCWEQKELCGYFDTVAGQFAISPQFKGADDFAANGLAPIEKNGKWGYIDAKGQMVILPQFEDAGGFAANGLAKIKQNGKYGYIDAKGQMVIPPQFEYAGSFPTNGLAVIMQNGKWGYIDAKGQVVIPPQFGYAFSFAANGLAEIKQNGKSAYIDTKGKRIVYQDTVCDTPVVKNSDDQVVWPKKPVADICAEAEYARNREHESRVRDSIDSANREASYRAYQQCKVEMDSCYLRTNGKGNCYRDCDRLR